MHKNQLWSRRAREGSNGFPGGPARADRPKLTANRARARTATSARRRRVLALLVVAVAVPAVVALATGITAVWGACAVMLLVLAAYLAVLIYARRMRAEREINFAFFGRPRAPGRGLEEVFAAGSSELDEISV